MTDERVEGDDPHAVGTRIPPGQGALHTSYPGWRPRRGEDQPLPAVKDPDVRAFVELFADLEERERSTSGVPDQAGISSSNLKLSFARAVRRMLRADWGAGADVFVTAGAEQSDAVRALKLDGCRPPEPAKEPEDAAPEPGEKALAPLITPGSE